MIGLLSFKILYRQLTCMQMILLYIYIEYDKQVLENNRKRSLVLLLQACKENGMLINTDKTKVMFITSR